MGALSTWFNHYTKHYTKQGKSVYNNKFGK